MAERYAADQPLQVGDVVELGGEKEVTKCNTVKSNKVFGVVSENPAFLMNKDAGNGEAMVAALEDCTAFNVIGRLIDNKYSTETELHECVIGVK